MNKVTIIGNVANDPAIRYTSDNRAIASLTVATSEKWKNKQGEMQEETEFHRVVVFSKLADVVEKYVGKGDKIAFEGRNKTRKWTDNDGNDRYSTEVVVDMKGTMEMLGSKSKSDDKPAAKARPASSDDVFDADSNIPF